MQDTTPVLTPATVGSWLAAHGLVADGSTVDAHELGGGVSNVVLAVRTDKLDAVVKQALPRLRVEAEWLAKQERALTEAAALERAGRISPGRVPAVLVADERLCAIAIERAPRTWRPWKEPLLTGDADPTVAGELGSLLATWHRETAGDREVAARFADDEAFDQLRVEPYHRAVAERWPRLGRRIDSYVEQMRGARVCLVHGDFSPKNVLVGTDDLWVIDFEVAHVGDPVFDLAFMLNHLLLKTVHRPGAVADYRACGDAFLEAYRSQASRELAFDPAYLFGQVGCLMVARVDGKSPAEYLSDADRLVARSAGTRLLLDPPRTVDDAWAEVHR